MRTGKSVAARGPVGALAALCSAVLLAGCGAAGPFLGIDTSDPYDARMERGMCGDGVVRFSEAADFDWDQVYFDPSLDFLEEEFGAFALRPGAGADLSEEQSVAAFLRDGELVWIASSEFVREMPYEEHPTLYGRDVYVEKADGEEYLYRPTPRPSATDTGGPDDPCPVKAP